MKLNYKKLILCLVILACVGATFYGIYIYFPNNRYENAFSQINLGESKEKVFSLLGKPSRIEGCFNNKDNCVEAYFYTGFLEEWSLDFDKEGKVTYKNHVVSQ